jgi:hypothetical protein
MDAAAPAGRRPAVDVPLAPREIKRTDRTRTPPDDRDWLTTREAASSAAVNPSTIARSRQVGVLPNTASANSTQPLYLRADIQRAAGHQAPGATASPTSRHYVPKSPATAAETYRTSRA